jgi:hypothetical protein
MYIRNTLNYKTDFKYNMFGPVRPWDNSNDAKKKSTSGDGTKSLFECDGSVWIL